MPPIPEKINDAEILQALENLPPPFRKAVVLTGVEEFSREETKARLKKTKARLEYLKAS